MKPHLRVQIYLKDMQTVCIQTIYVSFDKEFWIGEIMEIYLALSSVLRKSFQKILNECLLWFLESNNLLFFFQYSFCKERNTAQTLLDFQSEINDATLHKSSL